MPTRHSEAHVRKDTPNVVAVKLTQLSIESWAPKNGERMPTRTLRTPTRSSPGNPQADSDPTCHAQCTSTTTSQELVSTVPWNKLHQSTKCRFEDAPLAQRSTSMITSPGPAFQAESTMQRLHLQLPWHASSLTALQAEHELQTSVNHSPRGQRCRNHQQSNHNTFAFPLRMKQQD